MTTKTKTGIPGNTPQLSKREYFAGFALAGLLASGKADDETPKVAVAVADLLVKELDGRRGAPQS